MALNMEPDELTGQMQDAGYEMWKRREPKYWQRLKQEKKKGGGKRLYLRKANRCLPGFRSASSLHVSASGNVGRQPEYRNARPVRGEGKQPPVSRGMVAASHADRSSYRIGPSHV
ncbi:hypothetical protein PO124_08350 [Bacillus licheniformis]|nr:hypothetical protein [Bacillus licheniformis]